MKKISIITGLIIAACALVNAHSSAALYNEGVTLLAEGQYQEAVERFKSAAIEDSAHLQARLGLAQAYYKLSQWENAEIALKEALQLDPGNPDALEMAAKVKFKLKKYDDAAKVLETLTKETADPGHLSLLGNAYYYAKKRNSAVNAFERSLENGNENTGDHRKLSSLYFQNFKQKKDKADLKRCYEILDKALEIDEEAETFYLKGQFAYLAKEPETAKEALIRAVSLEASHENALYYLTRVLFQLHEYEEALSYGKQLLTVGKNSKYYALLGDICREKGDLKNASAFYRQGASYSDKTGQYCAQYLDYLNQPKQ
jgi:tetratricopeptide (TPR) repeat protein